MPGNEKSHLRASLPYVISFCVPIIMYLAACAAMGMAPWGDRTILSSDLDGQYIDMFCGLKNSDFLFSWSKAMGSPYISVISYYLSSPLSLLTLLVPDRYMPIGLMGLIALKLGLSGLTFCIYANRRFPRLRAVSPLFSMCYALMSYNVAYSIDPMWLDGIIWLPIILLCIERVLAGSGIIPLILSLTVCFVSNWYISYMIGIFCVIYTIYRLVCLKAPARKYAGDIGKLAGSAIIGLGLSSWLWLPTFIDMLNGKLSERYVHLNEDFFACHLKTLILQFLPFRYTSTKNASLDANPAPFVFCGTVILILFVLGLLSKRRPVRDRIAMASIFLMFMLSLWISGLDAIWHMMQKPTGIPGRYSFLLCTFMLVCAAEYLSLLPRLSELPRGSDAAAKAALLLILACVLTPIELFGNTFAMLFGIDAELQSHSYEAYVTYYDDAKTLLEQIEAVDCIDGTFRITNDSEHGRNESIMFGYPGVNHSSSAYNSKVTRTLLMLGCTGVTNYVDLHGATPFVHDLLGVKYAMSRTDVPYTEPFGTHGNLSSYENPDALPILFAADVPADGYGSVLKDSAIGPFERQNEIAESILRTNAVIFSEIKPTHIHDANKHLTLRYVSDGTPTYLWFQGAGMSCISCDGENLVIDPVFLLNAYRTSYYIGTYPTGTEHAIEIDYEQTFPGDSINLRYGLYSFDQATLSSSMAGSGIQPIQDLIVDGTRITGTVTSERQTSVCTTVPQINGWTVYIDGKPIEQHTFLGAFIMFDVPAGTHDIEMVFDLPGWNTSLAITAVSAAFLAIFCAYTIIQTRKRRGP